MKKLLITGFDPFGGGALNPSLCAVEALPAVVGDYELQKLAIPTVFSLAAQMVLEKAEELRPDVILCIGLAGGRDAVTPERIAVNIRDARIDDNHGFRPHGEKIDCNAPAAYFATVAVVEMSQAIRAAHIPSAVSNSAGTYVCNDVFFTLLHHFSGTSTKVGFIHVPYLPEQGSPSLPLETIVTALEEAIKVC